MSCPFAEKLEVYFEDSLGNRTYGFIEFICDSYVTVCFKQGEHRVNNTCLLFYPEQWHKLTPTTSKRK
jgi:hypothetical protein